MRVRASIVAMALMAGMAGATAQVPTSQPATSPARQEASSEANIELRETAIRLLAERGQTSFLVGLYDTEKVQDIKETILRLLAERDDEAGRRKVLEVAKTGTDAGLRETAIRLLAERGQTALLVELFDAEKDGDVKETILRLLAERDDEIARKKLLAIATTKG